MRAEVYSPYRHSSTNITLSKAVFFPIVFLWLLTELLIPYVDFIEIASVRPRYILATLLGLFLFFGAFFAAQSRSKAAVFVPIANLQFFMIAAAFTLNAITISALNGRPMSLSQMVIVLFMPTFVFFVSYGISRKFPTLVVTSIVAVTTFSCVISLLQALDLEFAWAAREALTDHLARGMRASGRNLGLAEQGVRAAELYLLGAAISTALYVFSSDRKRFWLLITMIHAAAIISTSTRSAVAALPILFLLAAILSAPRKWLVYAGGGLVISIAVVVSFVVISPFLEGRLFQFNDSSSQGRVVLTVLALELIAENPFGYGARSFADISAFAIYESSVSDSFEYDNVGEVESHNYFLNILFYYGIQGFLLIVALFVLIVRTGRRLLDSENGISKALGLMLILAIATQSFDSFFHNSSPFNGFSGLLILFGAAVASGANQISGRGKGGSG